MADLRGGGSPAPRATVDDPESGAKEPRRAVTGLDFLAGHTAFVRRFILAEVLGPPPSLRRRRGGG